MNTYLRLEDAAGNQLRQDDDGGSGLNSRIRFQAPRTGNYRVIATSLGRALGPFNITVREVE